MIVRVARMPGSFQEIELDDGATVGEAISAANLDPAGYEIRSNNQNAELGDLVEDGQSIMLVKKVKGN